MVFVPPKDRVLEHSTSNSQTIFTVTGALDTSYNAFSASMSIGDTTTGAVVEAGVAFKAGLLTYSNTNEVTVTSADDSKGTFSAGGVKEVFMGKPAARAVGIPDVIIEDQKASATAGGTATSGSFQTRTLNTFVRSSSGAIITLSANQLIFPVGTFFVKWSAPAYFVQAHQTRFRNITDTTTAGTGTVEYATNGAADASQTRSEGACIFTFTAAKTFELQHIVGTTKSTNGFGLAGSFTTEVYARVEITRL